MGNEMTTGELAKRWGKTPQYIRLLCREGYLKARKIGRDWIIDRRNIEEHEKARNGKGAP